MLSRRVAWSRRGGPEGLLTDEKGRTVKLLETLQAQCPPDHLTVDYFVDDENTFIKPIDVSDILAKAPETTLTTVNSGRRN